MGEVQRDPTTAPVGVAPDYARLGKPVSQLEELAAGNLHGEVCEGVVSRRREIVMLYER